MTPRRWTRAVLRAAPLLCALGGPARVHAHPPPLPVDSFSPAEMIRKLHEAPFSAVPGDAVEDRRAYRREGYLDMAGMRVIDGDPLVVEVSLYEPLDPDPGGLMVFLTLEGSMEFLYCAYQPEGGEWGLFEVGDSGVFDRPVGRASFRRDGTLLTVAIPRADIPLESFLVHAHTLSGPDADHLWKDDCPNERDGLAVPPRTPPPASSGPAAP